MDNRELCTIRHRNSSGQVDLWWEFHDEYELPTKQSHVTMSVRLGSAAAVIVEVPVCTHRSRKERMAGRWIIVPKDECRFILTAARMPVDFNRIVHNEAFHEDLPAGSVVLIDAPEDVARKMAAI